MAVYGSITLFSQVIFSCFNLQSGGLILIQHTKTILSVSVALAKIAIEATIL